MPIFRPALQLRFRSPEQYEEAKKVADAKDQSLNEFVLCALEDALPAAKTSTAPARQPKQELCPGCKEPLATVRGRLRCKSCRRTF